jgi:hypothetical protein
LSSRVEPIWFVYEYERFLCSSCVFRVFFLCSTTRQPLPRIMMDEQQQEEISSSSSSSNCANVRLLAGRAQSGIYIAALSRPPPPPTSLAHPAGERDHRLRPPPCPRRRGRAPARGLWCVPRGHARQHQTAAAASDDGEQERGHVLSSEKQSIVKNKDRLMHRGSVRFALFLCLASRPVFTHLRPTRHKPCPSRRNSDTDHDVIIP